MESVEIQREKLTKLQGAGSSFLEFVTNPVPHKATHFIDLKKSRNSPSGGFIEVVVSKLLFLSAVLSVVTSFGIIIVLTKEMSGFFSEVSVVEFLTGRQWYPLLEPQRFGVLPLLSGSFMVAVGACALAIPLGIFIALYLSEYAGEKFKILSKSFLEILTAIPTVVYGYLALTLITPFLRSIVSNVEMFNALSAAIVVGVMVIPTIASLSQDAFQAVPQALRDAAYGLGTRKHQISVGVVFPAGISGVVASILLAFSRAIGETMAVTLAAGATPNFSLNFYQSIQTMTAYIVQVSKGDTPAGTIEYKTIFAVGLLLFLITLASNLAASLFVRRFQEKY